MFTRLALRTIAFLLGVLTSLEAWSGVALQSFTVEPSVPGTQIFSSIGAVGAPGPESGPGAAVAWPVTIDFALLNTLPATLPLNFPDRAPVTLTRMRSERRSGSALIWTGRSNDCSALFSVSSDGFKATLSCLNAQYGVDHLPGSASLRLSRYDNAGTAITYEPLPGMPPGALQSAPASPPPAIPDTTVDILVLFNGSMTSTNIWAVAQYAVDQTQLAMDRSTFNFPTNPSIAQLKLAGAARISRTVSSDPAGDLQALRTDPEAIALRNYWAADVIVYLTTGGGAVLGIANVPNLNDLPMPGPTFAPFAIAVSLAGYATNPGDYVVAHEFAHTFGANHNPDHLPANPTPVRPWAFGHWGRETETGWGSRTIMSYLNECIGHPCDRILNYSNPQVYEDWFRTGLNNRDNARLIQEMAPFQAQYRASVGRIFADGFD